jgi:hypothetical protein
MKIVNAPAGDRNAATFRFAFERGPRTLNEDQDS